MCRGTTPSTWCRGSRSDDVVLTLVKDGESPPLRPEDLERLIRAVAEF